MRWDPGPIIRVTGTAQPQGSTKAFMPKGGRFPVVTSDNPKLKGWRSLIAHEAQQAAQGWYAFEAAVRVVIMVTLPRPKAIRATQPPHTKKPDIDKLARGIFDALTGVVWRDDSQVVELHINKHYALAGEAPGIVVTLFSLENETDG